MELMTMPVRRLHRMPILCLLVLCLLTSPASSFGYVWCVGADGHATLEAALAGDCGMDSPAPPAGDFLAPALIAETDDCGPCLDISSLPRWGSGRARGTDAPVSIPVPLAAAASAPYLPLPDRLPAHHCVASLTPRPPDPIRHHRTTVLLI